MILFLVAAVVFVILIGFIISSSGSKPVASSVDKNTNRLSDTELLDRNKTFIYRFTEYLEKNYVIYDAKKTAKSVAEDVAKSEKLFSFDKDYLKKHKLVSVRLRDAYIKMVDYKKNGAKKPRGSIIEELGNEGVFDLPKHEIPDNIDDAIAAGHLDFMVMQDATVLDGEASLKFYKYMWKD